MLDLIPPLSERTVPTRREVLINSLGVDEVARSTGRVVVEQADGTKAIVPPEFSACAKALAAHGRLAELVNGEGTAPKPTKATTIVTARDAEGFEIRSVLTDSPEKTASAVRRQREQGLAVEVRAAAPRNMYRILKDRLRDAQLGEKL